MARRMTRRARPQPKAAAAPVAASAESVSAPTETLDFIIAGGGAGGSGSTPLRPALRPAARDDDPRARAAKRAAELRDHGAGQEEGVDEFAVPAELIPDGWDYEWKRDKVLGAEDPAYQVQTARAGWEPVPASRHPSFMPKGWRGEAIERKGMVLMERPKEISDEARRRELRKARQQVRTKEEQLNAAPQGQFERQKSDGSGLVKIGKSYEAVPIPE